MSVDREEIKAAVHAALDERDGIDRNTHSAHHAFVARLIAQDLAGAEQARARANIRYKTKLMIIGGLALALLTAAGSGLYNIGKFVIELYQKTHTGN